VLVLGDIQATVLNSAASNYGAKELLQLGAIQVNLGAITGTVNSNGVHINAYLGDVTGNGTVDGLDTLAVNQVAIGAASGFNPYQLLDPVIIGDVAGDLTVDAGDTSAVDLFVAKLNPPQIPTPPNLAVAIPNAADPTLSLKDEGARTTDEPNNNSNSSFSLQPSSFLVSVMIDHPQPQGSTGLTEVSLALTYDPSALAITAADISLGSIPSLGTGWQISAVVDQTTGQIGIQLYSLTPIDSNQAGSLVNIAFNLLPGARASSNSVQLVNAANPNGQWFRTGLDDTQGPMILSLEMN
jgi:hypothetical protein